MNWFISEKILIIGLLVFFSQQSFGFSVGAVKRLNCGSINKPILCTAGSVLDNYETVHQNITQRALSPLNVDYTPPDRSTPIGGFKFNQIQEIKNANRDVDYYQSDHELHFDNEYFFQGINHLDKIKLFILDTLSQPIVIDKTTSIKLRKSLGQYFHTLQDFFAHSSWVNIHPGLQDIPRFWTSSANLPSIIINPCPYFVESELNPLQYDTSTLGPDSFTSGYAGSLSDLIKAVAPDGKCAHGLATNGIHKDWTGRDFHPEARAQAIYATSEATKYIINNPGNNPDNVCMLMTDNVCPVTTTVTIDTSGSTGNGTVTSNPSGINCTTGNSNGCSSEFEPGTIIVLTATPDINSTFQGWSGLNASNCQNGTTQPTCTLNLVENFVNITATFTFNKSNIYYFPHSPGYGGIDIYTLDRNATCDPESENMKIIVNDIGLVIEYMKYDIVSHSILQSTLQYAYNIDNQNRFTYFSALRNSMEYDYANSYTYYHTTGITEVSYTYPTSTPQNVILNVITSWSPDNPYSAIEPICKIYNYSYINVDKCPDTYIDTIETLRPPLQYNLYSFATNESLQDTTIDTLVKITLPPQGSVNPGTYTCTGGKFVGPT